MRSAATTSGRTGDDSVRVCCRVRPLNKAEESSPEHAAWCVAFPTAGGSAAPGPSSLISCNVYQQGPSISVLNGTAAGGASSPTAVGSPTLRETAEFEFSTIFPPAATQQDVYNDVAGPVVMDVMNGYNGTVFVYGQTGSGKTHTVFGDSDFTAASLVDYQIKSRRSTVGSITPPLTGGGRRRGNEEDDISNMSQCSDQSRPFDNNYALRSPATANNLNNTNEEEAPGPLSTPKAAAKRATPRRLQAHLPPQRVHLAGEGIVPRCVYDLFQHIEHASAAVEFEVRIFFVEVYMEQARDLLAQGSTAQQRLPVREDVGNNCFYVDGCAMPFVSSAEELIQYVRAGLHRRATFSTNMNDTSSRSHSILNITVKSFNRKLKESKIGKLFLVDLAGSEKVSKTKSSGTRLEEAKLINKSLSTLGMVIVALTERAPHIPYRDSVLTKILKDSLGGNSRTTLVICCSPSAYNAEETMSTLRFGARAKNIQNRAIVNRQLTLEEMKHMLDMAKEEIARLHARLREFRAGGGSSSSKSATTTPRLKQGVGNRITTTGAKASSTAVSSLRRGRDTAYPSDSPLQSHPRLDNNNGAASPRLDEIEELLRERAYERVRFTDLTAELNDHKDQLKTTEDMVSALSEHRDALHKQVNAYQEEISAWEEEYATLQHRLAGKKRLITDYRARIVAQQQEIQTLMAHMASYLQPIESARLAFEEVESLVFGPNVTSQRKRTLVALGASPCRTPLAGPSPTEVALDGSPDAKKPLALRREDLSVERTALSMTPLHQPHQHQQQPHQRSLSAVNPAMSASFAASQEALQLASAQLRRSPVPMPLTAVRAPSPATHPSLSTSRPGGATAAYVDPNEVISSGASRRIVELEEQLGSTETTVTQLRQSFSEVTLELQLAQKKLCIRQNRIDSLKLAVQQESNACAELRRILERERATQRTLLQTARGDANYWRRRYEELGAEVRSMKRADGGGRSESYRSIVSRASSVAQSGSECGSPTTVELLKATKATQLFKSVQGGVTEVVEVNEEQEASSSAAEVSLL